MVGKGPSEIVVRNTDSNCKHWGHSGIDMSKQTAVCLLTHNKASLAGKGYIETVAKYMGDIIANGSGILSRALVVDSIGILEIRINNRLLVIVLSTAFASKIPLNGPI